MCKLKSTFFICLIGAMHLYAQPCKINNNAFKAGEVLVYEIDYKWGMIWASAGEVTFKTESVLKRGKKVFLFTGSGFSYPKYDWIYKVKDKYLSYADTSLMPLHYTRDTKEGSTYVYNDSYFNWKQGSVTYYSFDRKSRLIKDTIQVPECTKDVLTMIYYSRNLDFKNYKTGDKIPVSLYLDGKVYNQHITYAGKEKLVTRSGTYNCIKFKPSLIEGTIFSKGDEMTVWVTDDENRIPVYVETPIIVGTVKVFLKSASGLKHDLRAKIK